MPDQSPFVSIIIPTYNGADRICNILEALRMQTYQEFEVIIAIDGSTDNTREVVNDLKSDFQRITVIEQENKGRSIIRNFGARHANGEVLFFFDDDMRPVRNCVELHVQHHLKHANTILSGSQIEDFSKLRTDIQKFKAWLSRVWERPISNLERPLMKEELHLTAANLSISKKIFQKLDGFDERLKDIEDFDLAVRAYRMNIPIYFDNNAVGWHDDLISCRSYILRRKEYSKAIDDLLKLKPEIEPFIQKRLVHTNVIKKFFYNIFSRPFWVKLVDRNALMFLPRRVRYKMYELIIWGFSQYFPMRKI